MEGVGGGEIGGLPGLRAKAEHKHNSNRNQLEPSKLFMRQMDTFPRDFTLKHGSAPPPPLSYPRLPPRPPSTGSAPHTHGAGWNGDNYHFIKTVSCLIRINFEEWEPLDTVISRLFFFHGHNRRRNMFSFLHLQRRRSCSDLV